MGHHGQPDRQDLRERAHQAHGRRCEQNSAGNEWPGRYPDGRCKRGGCEWLDLRVTEKAFDEYHLYTLERTTTLRDRETKQVEFIRAAGVGTKQVYIYDGVKIDANRYNGWDWDNFRNDRSYGTESNPKIWVMREFANSQANHLGMPLPKGRVRFYRRNDDGQIEFTGENVIDHTPRDETVRIYTGNAFDLTGERARTDYFVDERQAYSHGVIRNQSPQPQKGTGGCPRGRAPVSRAELGDSVEFRRLQEDRLATPLSFR